MTDDFNYLSCPMCGSRLVYSEGTHDLCCVRNGYEIANRDSYSKYLAEKEPGYECCSLHERAGENEYTVNGADGSAHPPETGREEDMCAFAISFTESTANGTLWSVRVVHEKTNYFRFMTLLKKIEGRQRRRERLADNMPSHPKKIEKSPVCRLAFRYGLEAEDLFSIKFSTETVKELSIYYGISERDVRDIRNSPVLEGGHGQQPDSF